MLWRDEENGDGPLTGRDLFSPFAAADGVVVVRSCSGTGVDEPCRYAGIGPTGEQVWQADGVVGAYVTLPDPTGTGAVEPSLPLPEVVVIRTGGDAAQVRAAATGEVVAELEAGPFVAVSGDVVVHEPPRASDGDERPQRYELRGLSGDGTVDWRTETACVHPTRLIGDWLSFSATREDEEDDEEVREAFAIDITTGAMREAGPLRRLSGGPDADAGEPGPGLVVRRDQQRLTGVDLATGEETWERTTPGDAIPGVDVGEGAVGVFTRPDRGHNPFAASEDRENRDMLLVLDSGTGRVTGSRVTDDTVWTSAPVGRGQLLVVVNGEMSLIGARST